MPSSSPSLDPRRLTPLGPSSNSSTIFLLLLLLLLAQPISAGAPARPPSPTGPTAGALCGGGPRALNLSPYPLEPPPLLPPLLPTTSLALYVQGRLRAPAFLSFLSLNQPLSLSNPRQHTREAHSCASLSRASPSAPPLLLPSLLPPLLPTPCRLPCPPVRCARALKGTLARAHTFQALT